MTFRLRLENVNETSEFFSHALDMWCFLFFLAKCGGTDWDWESDLGDLLKGLANFASHRQKCQSVSGRKIFIDTPSGTSIWLPNLDQYRVTGYNNSWSKFMWKVSEIINVFKINFTLSIHHDGPCRIASLQMIHRTGDGKWKYFDGPLQDCFYKDLDVNGITLFNPVNICTDKHHTNIDRMINTMNSFHSFADHMKLLHGINIDDDGKYSSTD